MEKFYSSLFMLLLISSASYCDEQKTEEISNLQEVVHAHIQEKFDTKEYTSFDLFQYQSCLRSKLDINTTKKEAVKLCLKDEVAKIHTYGDHVASVNFPVCNKDKKMIGSIEIEYDEFVHRKEDGLYYLGRKISDQTINLIEFEKLNDKKILEKLKKYTWKKEAYYDPDSKYSKYLHIRFGDYVHKSLLNEGTKFKPQTEIVFDYQNKNIYDYDSGLKILSTYIPVMETNPNSSDYFGVNGNKHFGRVIGYIKIDPIILNKDSSDA